MESNLQPFQLKGRLVLWKFSPEHQKYIGWNLTADEEGCTSLVELLEGMHTASSSAERTIATELATPSLVKAVTGSRPHKTVSRLTLRYHKDEPQLWRTEEEGDALLIHFGEREIELLQTALYRVLKGESDFAIGDTHEAHLLYFWRFTEGR